MLYIKNKTLNTDVLRVLHDVDSYRLKRDGIHVINDFKEGDTNVMITCPYHKDGKERKPSCGVRLVGKKDEVGTTHCFTCGKTVGFTTLVSKLLGIEDSGSTGEQWLLENYDVSLSRKIGISLTRDEVKKQESYIPESELEKYRFYHPYMFTRGLTEEIIERYDIGYDKYNEQITFPVRDINGNCLFLGRRSVKSKFFVLPSDRYKPLYGVFELDYSKNDCYIVESFFNALTLVKWGYNAIALMGTGSNHQIPMINKLPFKTIHICLDGDMAGKHGTIRLCESISQTKLVVIHEMLPGKDVNDLTQEQFENLKVYNRNRVV